MAITNIQLKSGEKYSGRILQWRPWENWLTIISDDKAIKVCFDDIRSAVTEEDNERVDEIKRAKGELRESRMFGWDGFNRKTPYFNWET